VNAKILVQDRGDIQNGIKREKTKGEKAATMVPRTGYPELLAK
jgi:hypothetical protein